MIGKKIGAEVQSHTTNKFYLILNTSFIWQIRNFCLLIIFYRRRDNEGDKVGLQITYCKK